MSAPLTILFAGGGTGGHLYPGIAVAEAILRVRPDVKPLFLCTKREIDRVILGPAGFEFIPQPIVPPVTSVGGLLRFWKGWRETKDLVRRVLRERKPAAVLGLGGYAAGVAVKVAAQKGIPAALLNPDVIPGKANQFLMQFVKRVCCQFQQTAQFVKSPDNKGKIEVTGCPIRTDIRNLPAREQAARRLELDPRLNTLVVTGASQGATTVNEAVVEMLGGMTLRGWQILHLSGREHADTVRTAYRGISQNGGVPARVIDFTPAMADVWAVADLAVSRAGASSCAELTACGVPAVLMPYPFHRDKHQRLNAKVLEEAGAAVLVDDDKDRRKNAAKLRPTVEGLLYDGERRRRMAEAARQLGKPDAAENVANVLTAMIAPK
ncbi:MAG TPA: UDP-N-acetylglucosamine--N-acetylmuramyl-(pentapeptide) pyrophosphoryl-undecaprenol N-acetylglucosamine transferase [Tepidisphaeraceae bacterium]|nr:UDP-N-acetylglucosamine--N-acetylmuramyl-(pentapeptide) pyrophosphoryl-undecaprenol N-acetylglucosamine transferase [Tepidisphaeraceae bacterium]